MTRIVTEPMGNSILFPIGIAGPKDKRLMSRKCQLATAARLIYLRHLRIMGNIDCTKGNLRASPLIKI